MIVMLLEKEQSAWTTSLEADQRGSERDTKSGRMKTALQFRVGKKNVLLKSLKQLQQKAGIKPGKGSDRAFAKSA